jgi:outer membrane protein OmpA-like peptidoglycan-associated protein
MLQSKKNIFSFFNKTFLILLILNLIFLVSNAQTEDYKYLNNPAQKLKPTEKMVLVNVHVKDLSNKPRPDELIIFQSTKTKGTYKRVSDAEGNCSILLPKDDKYKIKYQELGSIVDYSNLAVTSDSGFWMLEVNVRFENSIVQALNNVHFENNKAILVLESFNELDRLVEVMIRKKRMIIEIAGHTDNIGNSNDNLILSQKRADTVREYLISKGIEKHRVFAKGYGDTDPVDENDTEEGRQLNRRAEVRILKE